MLGPILQAAMVLLTVATVARSPSHCSGQLPPFCAAAAWNHVPASNWSCAKRAAAPNPCDVCYRGHCAGGCSQCKGPPPLPMPGIAWRPQPRKPPPADWAPRLAAGQMFFSGDELRAGYTASLGNGFISGDAGCCTQRCTDCAKGTCRSCHSICTAPFDTAGFGHVELSGCGRLHIAGVFNGALGNSVGPGEPNRASVSNPHAVYVAEPLEWVGGVLSHGR